MFKKLIIKISKSIWLSLIVFAVFSIFFFTCDKTEENLAGPMLVSPANHTTLTTVTPRLQWLAVENAVNYEVFVDDLDDFTDPEFSSLDMEGTECKVDTLQEGLHYWKVRAKNGNWSDVWHFTIDTTGPVAPKLSSPSYEEVIVYHNTPTFDWEDVGDAVIYELEVDKSNSFSNPEVSESNLSISRYTPSESLSDGKYYWHIRAMDSPGNWGRWSNVWSFKIYYHETGTMTDIDGNVYMTVKIGDQWWMAENLKVTHYRNGDAIPLVTDNTEWCNLDHTETGARCANENYYENVSVYGYLFNWYAVSDNRKIAPAGWHVPTDEDWKKLEMYLGMSRSEADNWSSDRGTDEGDKLKEAGKVHWNSYNTGATNESGFTALPGGARIYASGSFMVCQGCIAYFWSSSEHTYWTPPFYAWARELSSCRSTIYRTSYGKSIGFSVRLVRD